MTEQPPKIEHATDTNKQLHLDAKNRAFLVGLQQYEGVAKDILNLKELEDLENQFQDGSLVLRGLHRWIQSEEQLSHLLAMLNKQGIDTLAPYNPNSGESLHVVAGFMQDRWKSALSYTTPMDSSDAPRNTLKSVGILLIYDNSHNRIVYSTPLGVVSKDTPLTKPLDMDIRDTRTSVLVTDDTGTPQYNNSELATFWKDSLKHIIVIEYPVPPIKNTFWGKIKNRLRKVY